MKMVVISMVVLLILIGTWYWFHFTYVEPNTDYFWEGFTHLSEKIFNEEWDKAETDMKTYITRWEEIRKVWIYFITQGDIDNIDSSFYKVQTYIKNREKVLAQAELEHLKLLFNVIKENECLALDNIF